MDCAAVCVQAGSFQILFALPSTYYTASSQFNSAEAANLSAQRTWSARCVFASPLRRRLVGSINSTYQHYQRASPVLKAGLSVKRVTDLKQRYVKIRS